MTGTSILAGSGALSKGLSIWYPYVMPSGTPGPDERGTPRWRVLQGMERLRAGDPRGVCMLLEAAGEFPGLLGLATGEISLWLTGRGRRHASQDFLAELDRLRKMYGTAARERATLPERTSYAPAALEEETLERLRAVVRSCDDEVRAAWIGRRRCNAMSGWGQVDIILEARSEIWLGGRESLQDMLERVAGKFRAAFDGDVSLLVAVSPYGVRPRVLAAMRKGGEALLDPAGRSMAGSSAAEGGGNVLRRLVKGWRTRRKHGRRERLVAGTGQRVWRLRKCARGLLGRLVGTGHALVALLAGGFAVRRLIMGTMVFSAGLPVVLAWQLFIDNSDTHARISMMESLRQERLQKSYWRNPEKLSGAGPEKVAEAYLAAMRAHDASPLLPLYSRATRQMLRKRRLTPVDMDARVAQHAGCGPLKVLVNGDNALVQHVDGTCPPFLMKREGGTWRVDLTVDPAIRTLVAETLPLLRGSLHDAKLKGTDTRADRLDVRG